MDQDRSHRAVDTTGEAANDLFVAHLRADFGNGFLAVGAHCPIAGEPRHPNKIFIDHFAIGRVMHFGVELHRVEMALRVGCDGIRCIG